MVERLGLDDIGVQDHPYQRRFVDTWTLLFDDRRDHLAGSSGPCPGGKANARRGAGLA
jgi:hypothetical protein